MSSLSDSANGTLTTDVDDGVAAEKASGDAMMASATPGSVEQVDRVVNNPQLSEFILRVVDRIGVVRNKIRDCKTDIETQKGERGKSIPLKFLQRFQCLLRPPHLAQLLAN